MPCFAALNGGPSPPGDGTGVHPEPTRSDGLTAPLHLPPALWAETKPWKCICYFWKTPRNQQEPRPHCKDRKLSRVPWKTGRPSHRDLDVRVSGSALAGLPSGLACGPAWEATDGCFLSCGCFSLSLPLPLHASFFKTNKHIC